MASQTHRQHARTTRRSRRSTGAARSYATPAHQVSTPVRRSYMNEPAPADYSAEYRFVRKDLFRIVIWAGLLIAVMFALWFLPVL
jgi:hypothetical protein